MTKPSEKDIQEAMEWVGLALEPFDDVCSYDHHGYCQSHFGHEKPCPYEPEEQEKHQHTIRTALKEYGKAKTVPRRFIDRVWDMAVDCVEYPHAVYGDLFKEGFLSALEEQGIEVMDDEIIVAEDENNDKK